MLQSTTLKQKKQTELVFALTKTAIKKDFLNQTAIQSFETVKEN